MQGWTIQDIIFIKENHRKKSVADIASTLGRTYAATQHKIARLGLSKDKKLEVCWQPWQDQILRDEYGFIPTKELIKKIGKSERAIYQRVSDVGLSYRTRIPWDEEQIQILQKGIMEGCTVAEIYEDLCNCTKKKYGKYHSKPVFRSKLREIGLKPEVFDGCDYFCIEQIAVSLGITTTAAREMIRRHGKILKPETNFSNKLGISRKNLKKWITSYPGEVAKCNPDLVWLIEVIS